MTCAQIAIMPRNRVSEASVAASSTTARTMTRPHSTEQVMNIVHDMFQVKRSCVVRSSAGARAKSNAWCRHGRGGIQRDRHHGRGTARSRALLETILDKAVAECTIAGVAVFNWTEPLLRPAVHELIGVVRSRAIHCAISTNLNVLRDPDLLMRANPDCYGSRFRVFTQSSTRAGTRTATSKW